MTTTQGFNKQWLAIQVEKVRFGSKALDSYDDAARAAIQAQIDQEHAEATRGKTAVRGLVMRTTAKAVLFQRDPADNSATFVEAWFPLSQCRLQERGVAHLDVILVPGWLLVEKNKGVAQ